MERTSDYWFMIEPYVHINIANGYMLLYNTLDKETIISNNEKVINLLPHTNFCNKRNEKYNFIKNANLLHFLNEIIIHLDHILDQDKLIDYLQSMPDNITYSISGDLKHIAKFDKLVDFLNQYNSSKKIIFFYTKYIFIFL